jgi:hypothetical protein
MRRRKKRAVDYIEPLHPVTQEPLTDLDRTLLRLHFVAIDLTLTLSAINLASDSSDAGIARSGTLAVVLCNYSLAQVVKFLEVLESWRTTGKDRRAREVKSALNETIQRIDSWPGLRQFRHTVLAHPYLHDGNKFVHPMRQFEEYVMPPTVAEMILLLTLSRFAAIAFLQAFASPYMALGPLQVLPVAGKPGHEVVGAENIASTAKEFIEAASNRLVELGIDPQGVIVQQFESSAYMHRAARG